MSRENKPWNYWFNPNNIQFELDWAYAKNEERRKAKQIPGSINPDNRSQYWSGTKWLNLSDIPDIPQTSEDKKQKAEEKAVAENELVGPISGVNYGKINATSAIFSDEGKVQDKGVSTANAAAKKQWLLDTANSPAAKAGIDPDERWRLNQAHQAFKARRSGAETSAQEQTNATTAGAFSPQSSSAFSGRDSFISQRSPFNPANQANMIDPGKSFSMPSLNLPEVKQYQKLADLPTNAFTNANMNTAAAEGAGFMGFKDAASAAKGLGGFSKGLELLNKMTAEDPKPNINVSRGKLDDMEFPTYLPTWY